MATSFNDAQQTSDLVPLPIINGKIFDLLEDSDLVTEVLFEYYGLKQDHSHISLPVNKSPTAEQVAPEQNINTEARNLHSPLQPLPDDSQVETRENQVTQTVCQQGGGPSEELEEEPIFNSTISATSTDSEATLFECLGHTHNREEFDLFFDFNKYVSERSTDRSEGGPSVLWTEEASRFNDSLATSDSSDTDTSSSVEEVPPWYSELYGGKDTSVGGGGTEALPKPVPNEPTIPPAPSATPSLGPTPDPTRADASAGPTEASPTPESGDAVVAESSAAGQKRKRVSFAGENDTSSQDDDPTPPGRHTHGFNRTLHDERLRPAKRGARERMAKRFNTTVAPVEHQIGDVVSAAVPQPYREGKTATLVSIVHEVVVSTHDNGKMYRVQTPCGIVDRTFASHELELLDPSMKPDGLEEPQALTNISLQAAVYRTALTLGVVNPSCKCKAGCHNNRCSCRRAMAKCTRDCHNNKHCSNHPEADSGGQDGGNEAGGEGGSRAAGQTRAGRQVKPTRRSLGLN